MSGRSPLKVSFAATITGCAASAARSFCRWAYTPADEDRDRVDETRLLASCCRNLSYLVHFQEPAAALGRIASKAAASYRRRGSSPAHRVSPSSQVGTTAALPTAWARILS